MNIQGHEDKFRAFLAQNALFWRENTGYPRDENSRLYVDLAHDNAGYLLTNLWVAKYLQKVRGGRLIGLAHRWMKPCPAYQLDRVRELAHSFLVEEVIDLDAGPNEVSDITQRFAATVRELKGGSLRKAILGFEADTDPDLGWVLYDTWLRQEFCATANVCEPELLKCADSVFRARQAISRAMRGGKTIGAVVGHYHYSPYSFMALEAARQQAPVYFQWILVPVSIRKFANMSDVRRGRAEAFASAYEEYLRKRVTAERLEQWKRRMFDIQSGTREFFRVLEGRTQVQSRSDFLAQLRLDPQRPVVCFYVPALCAAPHCFGTIPYDDFADWLRQSLEIAAETPGINFIVKRHPQDAVYDRSGFVSQLETVHNRAPNIRFLERDVPAEQMVEVCDLVALMSGTPGYEMAARGVPTVTAGPSRYSGLGFAKEALDIESYRGLLADAGAQKLSDEDREGALQFAYFELAAGRSQSLFIPRMKTVGTAQFWSEAELNLRSRYVEEDPLFRNMKYMVEQNLPFLLNTDLIDSPPPSERCHKSEDAASIPRFYAAAVSVIHALEDRAVAGERKNAYAEEEVSQALAFTATLMRHGRSVQFGSGESGNYLLGRGWSTPEPNGVWSDGYSAEILLPWVAGKAVVCLECRPFAPEFSPVRIVELFCNDVQLDRKDLRSQVSPYIWTIDLCSTASRVRILLGIPEPAMTAGDPRLLGLWLSRLWVLPDATKHPWQIRRY